MKWYISRCLPLPRKHQLHGRWRRHRSQRLWRMCPHRWLLSDLEDCNGIFTSSKSARSRLLQGRCASVRPVQGLRWNGATSQTLDGVPAWLEKAKGLGTPTSQTWTEAQASKYKVLIPQEMTSCYECTGTCTYSVIFFSTHYSLLAKVCEQILENGILALEYPQLSSLVLIKTSHSWNKHT